MRALPWTPRTAMRFLKSIVGRSLRRCPRTGRVVGIRMRGPVLVLYPLLGFLALIWFLVRVVPKPSRMLYPCQRVAAPLASGFIAYIASLAAAVLALRKARLYFRQYRWFVAGLCLLLSMVALLVHVSIPAEKIYAEFVPTDPANTPAGEGIGVYPGRVVLAHDTAATSWDGSTGYWWNTGNIDQDVVDTMMSNTIRWLAGKDSDTDAWDALFMSFNRRLGKGTVGYQSGEKIAIKVNLNQIQNSDRTWTDNSQNPSPPLVHALLDQLVNRAGVSQGDITVADPSRFIADSLYYYCLADFPDVHYVDRDGGSGREQARPDTLGTPIYYANDSVWYSGETWIASCFTEADYLINCGLLRGHNLAGLTVCAKNHFGSIWKDTVDINDGWSPNGPDPMKHLHGWISPKDFDSWGWVFPMRPMGSYTPMPELMGHEDLGGKTMLFMVDGLYAAEHQSSTNVIRWSSEPFGTSADPDWTSCLFASQDGVALESVVLDFLRNEPAYDNILEGTVDNYLHEAALAHDPPSGSSYDPENDGSTLASLGVHEHWNSGLDRKYSRNLGIGNGIELITEEPRVNPVALIAPADDAAGVSTGPELIWHEEAAADSYAVRISTVPDFSSDIVVNAAQLTDTTYTVSSPLNQATTYYWQVRAIGAGNSSAWSSIRSFTTAVSAPPSAPTLVSPSDGAAGETLTPTLLWNTASAADSYFVQVSTVEDFSATVVDQSGLLDTSFTTGTLSHGTRYFWRVSATNDIGTGAWSAAWDFTTLADVPPPEPSLLSPADGAVEVLLPPTLSWSDVTEADTYRLQVSTVSDFTSTVIDEAGLGATDYTASGLDGVTNYFWRVNAGNGSGTSAWSAVFDFTTADAMAPWEHGDIGNVGIAGDAVRENGVFTVRASGDDIWNNDDEFHYVYRPLSGDGEIVARVLSLEKHDGDYGWAKAGVMIREQLNDVSKHAMMVVTSGNGTSFQRRPETGTSSYHSTPGDGVTAPCWVKLVREGDTFTGYKSSDGHVWSQVGSATVTMNADAYLGLALTAHNDAVLNTAEFDNVRTSLDPTGEMTGVRVEPADEACGEQGPDAGSFAITVTLDSLLARDSTLHVAFELSGEAVAGDDYQTVSPLYRDITVPAGTLEQSDTVEIVPVDDPETEPNERVVLSITPDPAYELLGDGSATVYIRNDDPLPASVAVTESTETVTFKVPSVASPGQAYDWANLSTIKSYLTTTDNGSVQHSFRVIHLDNGLLRVTISPDLGMRVLRVLDKTYSPPRRMFETYDDPANWVQFAQNIGGIKPSFPYVENSTGMIDKFGNLAYKAGYYIDSETDGAVRVVMNLRFEYNQSEEDAGFLGKYGDRNLTSTVTLRPGASDFEVNYIADNPNPLRRTDRIWQVCCFPDVYGAGGQWLFPTKYALWHLAETLYDIERDGPIDNPSEPLEYDGSYFAMFQQYPFAGVYYPGLDANHLRLFDPVKNPGSKIYNHRNNSPPYELWGGTDNVFEAPENFMDAFGTRELPQCYRMVRGIGKVAYANEHVALSFDDTNGFKLTCPRPRTVSVYEYDSTSSPMLSDTVVGPQSWVSGSFVHGLRVLVDGEQVCNVKLPLEYEDNRVRYNELRASALRSGGDGIGALDANHGLNYELENIATKSELLSSLASLPAQANVDASDDPEVLLSMANTAYRHGGFGEVEGYLSLIGDTLREYTAYLRALMNLEQGLPADFSGTCIEGRYFEALGHIRDGDRSAAVYDLNLLLAGRPSAARPRLLLAYLSRDPGEALPVLERNPGSVELWTVLDELGYPDASQRLDSLLRQDTIALVRSLDFRKEIKTGHWRHERRYEYDPAWFEQISLPPFPDQLRYYDSRGNRRPVALAGADRFAVDQGGDGTETVSLDGSESADPDGSIVSWEWNEAGGVIATGATPAPAFGVGVHAVTLVVTDDDGAVDSDFVLVEVRESENRAPELTVPDTVEGWESDTIRFSVSAIDPDGDEVSVGAGNLPGGAVYDDAGGEFVWMPSHDQSGTVRVVFLADDGFLTTWDTTVIVVHDIAPEEYAVFAVGHSSNADRTLAAREASLMVLNQLGGTEPQLVLVYTMGVDDQAVLDELAQHFDSSLVVGGAGRELFGVHGRDATVRIAVVGGSAGMATALEPVVSDDYYACGTAIGTELSSVTIPPGMSSLVLLMGSCNNPDNAQLVEGVLDSMGGSTNVAGFSTINGELLNRRTIESGANIGVLLYGRFSCGFGMVTGEHDDGYGTNLWVAGADHATRTSVGERKGRIGLALAFDASGRYDQLGDELDQELFAIKDGLGEGALLSGTYGYGEMGRADNTSRAYGSGLSISMVTLAPDTVYPDVVSHRISATADTGGSIAPRGAVRVLEGEDVSFTITPDASFEIDSVFVDESYVGAVSTYLFDSVTADHSIHATFRTQAWTLTAAGDGGGTVTPSEVPVYTGDTVDVSAVPHEGNQFVQWTVVAGDVSVGDPFSASTEVVLLAEGDAEIMAEFSLGASISVSVDGTGGPVRVRRNASTGWYGRHVHDTTAAIGPLAPGTHTLAVMDSLGRTGHVVVTLEAGQDTTVDVTLRPRLPVMPGAPDTAALAGGGALEIGEFHSVVHGDLDGDGVRELVSVVADGTARVYSNDSGLWSLVQSVNLGIDAVQCARAVDWNSDTRGDLMVARHNGDIMLCRNRGGLTFDPAMPLLSVGADLSGFDIEAFDGDSVMDFVVGYENGTLEIGLSTEAGGWEFAGMVNDMGSAVSVVSYASPVCYDMSGDGIPDMMIGDGGGEVRWWRGTAGGAYEPRGLVNAGGDTLRVSGRASLSRYFGTDGRLGGVLAGQDEGKVLEYAFGLIGNVARDGREAVDGADLRLVGDAWYVTEDDPGWNPAVNFDLTGNAAGRQVIDEADLGVFGECWGTGRP